MSDTPRKFSRREFNLAGFSAGLATLTMPWLASAQEDQQQLIETPPKKSEGKGNRKQAARKGVPREEPPRHLDYASLQLVATVTALETHLGIDLHLINTSEKVMDVPHTMGGIPNVIPVGELILSQQKFALDIGLPPEAFERVSRAAYVEYLKVQPSGKEKKIKTFFASYVSPWPEAMIKDVKRYARQEAKVDVKLTLERTSMITRTGKSRSELLATSHAFTIPKTLITS